MPYRYSFCYHSIGFPDVSGLSIEASEFEKQIQFLVSTGKPIIKVEDNKSYRTDTINITFDDGYADNFETAALILNKYNIPATFYITTGAISGEKKIISRMKQYSHGLEWMSAKNVKQLFDMGHEIGNHTHSHPCLASLSAEDLQNEILFCQNIIREIIGKYPTSMAVPFGRYKIHLQEEQIKHIRDTKINNIALLKDLPMDDEIILSRLPISQKTDIQDIQRYILNKRTFKNHVKNIIPNVILYKINSFETKICSKNSESII